MKRKKASEESSPVEEDKTKPDNPKLADIEEEISPADKNSKDSGENKKDKKRKKHNFTEQDLKRKKNYSIYRCHRYCNFSVCRG